MTPLTEEEYQYSLQWNDYYSRYYRNASEQKISSSSHSAVQSMVLDTYEQKAKNMKLLKKVRPEDIDLPPSVPPPPSTQPPPPVSNSSALSSEVEKKAVPDPALKAKTKKMIEMQLKFSRKQRDVAHSVASNDQTLNISVEHAPLPRQPSDSPDNVEKIESPKERSPPPPPPPPPMSASESDSLLPVTESGNIGIREPFNVTLDNVPKSLNSQTMQKINKDPSVVAGAKRQTPVLKTGPTSINSDTSDNSLRISDDTLKRFENSKLSSNIGENLMSEFQADNEVFRKEVSRKLDERLFEVGDEESTSGKQLISTDVADVSDVASEKWPQDKEDVEEEKVATKKRLSVSNSCESKNGNHASRKRDDEEELISVSHKKRCEKKIRHGGSKEKRRQSESGHRRSRSRSHRDSHRRSHSRGIKHKSRSRSHTPRDFSYRNSCRSRSRDRSHRHEGSYYDRRSYRRYRTPDAEDRYSYRRRHSSSKDRSSQRERSTSRELTPTVDKSSRSRSLSKSHSESLRISRQSSIERSVSQCKTTDSLDRSSSRHNSPGHGVSQKTEYESLKSQRQPDLESTDKVHKSANHSRSPRSEKDLGKKLEAKAEKSKKHKKTKEKHRSRRLRKRKKSHHKKRDRKKSSPYIGESELDEKFRASSVLSDETDINMNTSLNQLTDEGVEIFSTTQKEMNDPKNERTKKKKDKKKKKEHCNMEGNGVTKKTSCETLEDGEIITEKDSSPRAREKVVNYATSGSEEEKNNMGESRNPAEQLIGNCNTKGITATMNFAVSSKAPEIATKHKEDFNDANIIRSSVLSFDLIDEMLEVGPGSTTMSKLGKEVKQNCESMNPTRETKITVDLEDDGISSKHKGLISDFNEITAREAEKLKVGNITEAMNKLKELRGYDKSKVTVSKSTTETETIRHLNDGNGNDSTFVGHSLADVPLPKAVDVAKVERSTTPTTRAQEACTSAKIDSKEKDVRRQKETLKRKWEEDEEDELCRLRYEALRSKTWRLMNDLKAERRRLKRERLRATIAMRRARERSVDASFDEILLADTSESTETDDSEDYSPLNKRKLLKRKRHGGREAALGHSNQNKLSGSEQRISDDENIKQLRKHRQNAVGNNNGEDLESCAPNNLILELQQRIGGSNESALALLEQLKKCLTDGAVSSTIHVNPEIIRKNA